MAWSWYWPQFCLDSAWQQCHYTHRFLPTRSGIDAHHRKQKSVWSLVLAFEGVQLLDVAGPVQTFASANEMAKEAGRAPYRIVVASRRGGPTRLHPQAFRS